MAVASKRRSHNSTDSAQAASCEPLVGLEVMLTRTKLGTSTTSNCSRVHSRTSRELGLILRHLHHARCSTPQEISAQIMQIQDFKLMLLLYFSS